MQKRALIIEDEADTCELIEKVLGSTGMEFLTLTKSLEAPGILNEGKFSLVFLDQHMASPDGLDLTRLMRDSSLNHMTPIIMISDDQRPGALAKGFQAGASFILYKPIDKDRLLKLVRATQGNMEHERRKIRRVPWRSRICLRNGRQEIEGETLDVSMEGLLVSAPRTFPVGSFVDIRMELPRNARPIVGAGSVVRLAAGNQMGIHLGRLPFAESQRLQELLLPLIPPEIARCAVARARPESYRDEISLRFP
jgi:DNA-binding response OmpR family regulator